MAATKLAGECGTMGYESPVIAKIKKAVDSDTALIQSVSIT
jgi:hypothetical protein